ncbi:hypothetical protein A2U01_0115764, partial [Trifolium medium]|nr:hypothetical protein [Trifolium medium]
AVFSVCLHSPPVVDLMAMRQRTARGGALTGVSSTDSRR